MTEQGHTKMMKSETKSIRNTGKSLQKKTRLQEAGKRDRKIMGTSACERLTELEARQDGTAGYAGAQV